MKVTKAFYNAASKAYVIAKHLVEIRKHIGVDAYLASPIRKQHVSGNIWFGINSMGDTDCLARQYRCMTDELGQKYSNYSNIDYLSKSCVDDAFNFKNTHRVEHTFELISFVSEFEKKYIINDADFTANSIAVDLLINQVVTIIKQCEQLTSFNTDDTKPFGKYNQSIIYCGEDTDLLKKGDDATALTRDQLIEVNRQRYARLVDEINVYNFADINYTNRTKLIGVKGKHTLPDIDVAVKYHSNQFMLLHTHYHHKLVKRIDSANRKWYSESDATAYRDWCVGNQLTSVA
jgi:hypothetical protein